MHTPSFAFVTATLLSSAAALAQTSPVSFLGGAVGLSVSAVQNKADFESTVASINGQSSQTNDSEAALLASYGYAMSPQWVGTLGFTYSLKSTDVGTVNYTAGGAQSFTGKIKEHLALSFAPGYRLGASTLVYGKLAYHQIKTDYTDTIGVSGATNHTGTGIGFGAAFALSPALELRAEYENVAYSSDKTQATTAKPKQSGLNFALLYKF